ncbi:hypothetical protein Hanom_Chr03g00277601 [Helianthus anomalus]
MEKQTIWMELEAGSKLEKKLKHQGVKWLFLKVWNKTVKVTKPQGAKRKFTLLFEFCWDPIVEFLIAKSMKLITKIIFHVIVIHTLN